MSWTRGLQPWLRPYAAWFVDLLRPYGVQVTSTYRSRSQQIALWNNRHNNPYPVAPPGRSMHERGRAFDMTGPLPVLLAAGALWIRMGGRWKDSDAIHFEA